MQAWYLVLTKARQEAQARLQLDRQGFRTYLPRVRRTSGRRRARDASSVEPLFPRYLFVYLSDRSDDWGPIRSTIGVVGLVRFGARAARVPDSVVDDLRTREDGDGLHSLPEQGLRQGERVRICSGPMSDVEAIYQSASGPHRVTLLLDIVGRATRVDIPLDSVERICA